ncbi:MAG: hypothetical protein L3K25_17970 [Gammaproteobacteria bacterium]|nr:hypothetical protein [Gammaproteobacteria bacterium]
METTGAAQQLMGQGGIPNVARVQGGQVSHIRLEHTWVEAWVDFEPSRGINNIQGDSWVPMDASFKQYDYSTGMNLQQNVPFDAQALVDAITDGTTINEAEGWVQNLPQQAVQDQFSQYQQQLETFINNQNPDATVGDVLGLQEVRIIPARPLSAGLPYKKVSTQQTFSEVPDNLRHKFKYQLATQNFGYPGSPVISFIEPTVKLAGKKLALSFKPASADDEAIINSYLPEPDAVTGEIDPTQLPNSLPGYLINLTAEFTLEGTVIQSAGAGFMGGELHETLALWSPASGWDQAVNNPTAGEYRAIGLDLQGVSGAEAARLQSRVEATKATLESADQTIIDGLSKHEVVGDLLYATIYSYLALNDVQDQIQSRAADVVNYRLPSYGIFSTRLQTSYWFGLPRNVSFNGLSMDVDHLATQSISKDNDWGRTVNFIRATGIRASAMEHSVPEQMFSTDQAPAQGVSAVKALALASAEGQRIWTIDQTNLNTALAAINLDADIENEIRSAVNAGKRAAGIPARYVYGSVEVPADKAMNWVGGVETAGAAQQLLGQGGIPNVARVQGGQVTHIRLEHTWVEAWVDFEPSRGINNIQGDSWVPMDASFKQYDFSAGMDLQQNVPFDAQALVDAITDGTTINEAEGWVQNLPQQVAEDQFSEFQQQVETYINNQNPAATVGDVLGLQEVRIIPARPLSAGLPYKNISTQQTFSEVPDNLRHKFKYQLATQNFGYPGSPVISFIEPTVKLVGKKLALSFIPASADDEAIINSYLPEPDPVTGDIDPTQLPNSLPGYLINLTAEFTLEGTVIESAAAGTMGGELHETLALWSPAFGWDQAVNNPTAGEYRAIGLDLQGASGAEAARLQSRVEATKASLESADQTIIDGLSKHEVVGDLLYATIYSYLALNDAQDQIQSRAAGVINYRLPSYGIFSTRLQTSYWFGLPRNVSFSGLSMDVDHLATQSITKDNDWGRTVNFIRATGIRASAMEHSVPEQMFSTVDNPAQGISAVKALAIASAEGQRIWTIDQTNLNTALAVINLDADIENEIRSAVNSGKVATAHDTPVAVFCLLMRARF